MSEIRFFGGRSDCFAELDRVSVHKRENNVTEGRNMGFSDILLFL
jgi:hypothetical protein